MLLFFKNLGIMAIDFGHVTSENGKKKVQLQIASFLWHDYSNLRERRPAKFIIVVAN